MSTVIENVNIKKSTNFKDLLSPHKLIVLIFVYEFCILKYKSIAGLRRPAIFGEITSDSTCQLSESDMKNVMILILKLIQSYDVNLMEILMNKRSKLSTYLLHNIKDRIKNIVHEGIHALSDFLELLPCLFSGEQPLVARTSVIGLFIRRMVLANEKLSMTQLIQLHNNFCKFYSSCEVEIESCDVSNLNDSMAELSAINKHGTKQSNLLSQSGLLGELNLMGHYDSIRQAENLFKKVGSESITPREFHSRLSDIVKMNSDLAEAHFLMYLNSLRVEEVNTAFHSLTRYFDTRVARKTDNESQNNKGRENVNRRYAALNLTSFYYHFRYRKEAMIALMEAIRMAQETNDNVCLQHALGWLSQLSDLNSDTKVLLERFVENAESLNLPHLASFGIQALARYNSLKAEPPYGVFCSLSKCDVVHCQYSQHSCLSSMYVERSALWLMYGKRDSSSLCDQLSLYLSSDREGENSDEMSCIALCNQARQHFDEGDFQSADELLSVAKQLFPSCKRDSYWWMICKQEMDFSREIRSSNWSAAQQAIINIKALNSCEADLRYAILKKDQGEQAAAVDICHMLLSESNDSEGFSAEFKCRVYLVLSQLHWDAENPTKSISSLHDCIHIAKTHHLSYHVAMANCYLASVQLLMNLPSQAMNILNKHMVGILTNGGRMDRARVIFLYLKCSIAQSSLSKRENKPVLDWAAETTTWLTSEFQAIGATVHLRNVLHLRAIILDQLGNVDERNQTAVRFKKISQLLQHLPPTLSTAF